MSQNVAQEPSESPIKRALRAVEDMQAKLEALTYAQREPIAVIGMGCRFPGNADSPDAFWQLLKEGRDAVGEVPPQRWDVDAYYDPDPDAPGKMSAREAGFLSQVDSFDAPFFGISAREATSLDPQQRLLLEVSWEALEHANQASERVFDSKTGVFVGICSNDYNKMIWETGGAANVDAFCATGNALSLAAGRISYALGLKGPSLSVDTACASSLVALHLACQHLRTSECDLAIASGVNLLLSPDTSIAFSRARMLDPSGRCKTFDANASGYARGEGAGAVVLKRLSDAQKDGDHILAVIKGSAVSHNGRSSSLVAPNGPAQQAVMRQALAMSGVDPKQIGYVEVQGTGTAVGQSLEVSAITSALAREEGASAPLYVGSVKTNFGHLEGASGIASLIKVILSLQHQTIPAHLHFQEPNTYINWEAGTVKVPTQSVPWPQGDSVRAAGINGFGFNGTNAHVILAEPPAVAPRVAKSVERPLHVMTLSAKNATSLQGLAASFQRYLETHPDVDIADICFSANTGRSHFQHRLAVTAASGQELSNGLAMFSQGQSSDMVWSREVTTAPKLALAFPREGRYLNLGRKLYETQPIFRNTIAHCNDLIAHDLAIPLQQFLYPDSPSIEDVSTGITTSDALGRVAMFAVEYGLYQLWRSWGIEPTLLIGEGIGEIVAACVAGVFSLEEGLKLVLESTQIPVSLKSPRYPIWSITSGQWVTDNVTQASFWRDRASSSKSPNGLADALSQQTIALVLLMGIAESMSLSSPSPDAPTYLASLHESQDWQTLLSSLATLYTYGMTVNWVGFDKPYLRRSLPLPTYVWRRQRYWFDAAGFGPLSQAKPADSLLPANADTTTLVEELTAAGDLSAAEQAFLPKLLTLLTQRAKGDSASTPAATVAEPAVDFKTLTAEDIQSWLVNRIAIELGVSPEEINPKAEFDSYGLDSVLAIGIASAGKQYLGVEVTPLMLIQYSTIEALSNHLVAEFEASGTEVFEL